jgi:hypothetical protein
MKRIKGNVVEILAPDTVLIEVAFVGKFNSSDLPDLVKVRFSELSPPYPKHLEPEQVVEALNGSILGAYVSANINGPDSHGIFAGKISREEPAFRGKRRSL